MRKRSLMLRGAAAAAYMSLIATLWACGGDDSTPVGDDGGGQSGSSSGGEGSNSGGGSSSSSSSSSGGSSGSSSSSGGNGGSGGSSSGSTDAGHDSGDGGSGGSSSGGTDAGHDGGNGGGSGSGSSGADSGSDGGGATASDAAHDATVGDATMADGNGGDVTTADAADAGRAQLMWCPWLDYTYMIGPSPDAGVDSGVCATETPPSGSCPDRAGVGWANAGQTGIASDFTNILYADCRTMAMGEPPVLTNSEVNDYLNQTTLFTLAFFGCPDPTVSSGPFGGFGLIPEPLIGHAFTTADVQLLEQMYVAGINQSLSDNGSPALTADQTTAVQAALASWGASVSATPSSTYSYADPSTCNLLDGGALIDAGPDGESDAGADGESDGGTDSESDAGADSESDAGADSESDTGGG